MKRVLAAAIFVLLLLGALGFTADDAYYFAVVGDLQQPDKHGYKPVTREIIRQIAASRAKFVVMVGDLTAGHSPAVWRQFDQLVKPLRDAGKEIYAVIGNHDAPHAAGFVERFGQRRRVVAKPGAWLVLMDSEAHADGMRDWALGDSQREWLESKPWLAETTAGPNPLLFFFVHRPVFRSELMKADPLGRFGRDKPEIAALLRGLGADAAFCGHEHLYERRDADGFVQIITGSGGRLSPIGYYHFLLVEVSPAKPRWDVQVVRVNVEDPEGVTRPPNW
jgi:predicted phosphodiesterase